MYFWIISPHRLFLLMDTAQFMIVNELTWILEIKIYHPPPRINPYAKANQL
jgi:hypothetical protein